MTNTTPHEQVPEVLIDLIDAYAETRHRCGGIYNARTEAARKAVIEALSGVQALSAAPAIGDELRDTLVAVSAAIAERDDRAAQKMIGEILAASPPPTSSAEQQAPPAAAADTVVLEAALRAIHQAIDLIGEPDTERLRTVRRVLRGAVIVAEEAGEAATAPQPAPATQQAGDVVAYLDVGAGGYMDLGSELSEDALQQLPKGRHALVIAGTYGIDGYVAAPQPSPTTKPAPQQEAQEPGEIPESVERMAADRYKVVPSHESMFHRWAVVAGTGTQQLYVGREVECQNMARKFAGAFLDGAFVAMQHTAPQPAPLSEMPYEKRKAIQEGEQIGASDAWFKARHEMLDTLDRRNVFRAGFDRGWNAAIAAHGGNKL